jgi:hypothetical protein
MHHSAFLPPHLLWDYINPSPHENFEIIEAKLIKKNVKDSSSQLPTPLHSPLRLHKLKTKMTVERKFSTLA